VKIVESALEGVVLLEPRVFGDARGFFFESFNARVFRELTGVDADFVQDNHSRSARTGSPTRGQWVSLILDAATGNQILVPKGFGHAFQTLEPDCEVQYKVTAPYAPACDRSIRWDDPAIGVVWPVAVDPELLSAKDRDAPLLSEQVTGF